MFNLYRRSAKRSWSSLIGSYYTEIIFVYGYLYKISSGVLSIFIRKLSLCFSYNPLRSSNPKYEIKQRFAIEMLMKKFSKIFWIDLVRLKFVKETAGYMEMFPLGNFNSLMISQLIKEKFKFPPAESPIRIISVSISKFVLMSDKTNT